MKQKNGKGEDREEMDALSKERHMPSPAARAKTAVFGRPFFVGHRNLSQALDQAVVLNDETEPSHSPVWKVLDPD